MPGSIIPLGVLEDDSKGCIGLEAMHSLYLQFTCKKHFRALTLCLLTLHIFMSIIHICTVYRQYIYGHMYSTEGMYLKSIFPPPWHGGAIPLVSGVGTAVRWLLSNHQTPNL